MRESKMRNFSFFFHYMICAKRLVSSRPKGIRTRSHMDRVSVYDNHNRTFYIYYLGIYHNRPMYHYGETNDIDVTEFFLRSRLPFYNQIMYIPIDAQQHAFTSFSEFIKNERVTLPVHSLEHMDVFSTTFDDIETILQKVQHMYGASVDEWV